MFRASTNQTNIPNNSVKFTSLYGNSLPYNDDDEEEEEDEEDIGDEKDDDDGVEEEEHDKGVKDFMEAISQPSIDLQHRSKDQLCGLGSWRPSWLQAFANHRVYAVTYVIISIAQGMTYTYFNGVITTVEKTFGIPSSKLGFILSGNDISQILCGVLITYIAGRGSRPFWMSIGMLITAASLFMYSCAQLFYDPEMHKVFRNQTMESLANETEHNHVMCHETVLMTEENNSEYCHSKPSSVPALTLFFVGQFISGVGSTALFTLGFTYMDDSVKKSNFPLYMSKSH